VKKDKGQETRNEKANQSARYLAETINDHSKREKAIVSSAVFTMANTV
jgi:hypothetical protein